MEVNPGGGGGFFEWAFGLAITVIGFFLKHLHTKVDESASKSELAAAIKAVEKRRTEDREEDERRRREDKAMAEALRQDNRDIIKGIFARVDHVDVALARIEGKLEANDGRKQK